MEGLLSEDEEPHQASPTRTTIMDPANKHTETYTFLMPSALEIKWAPSPMTDLDTAEF